MTPPPICSSTGKIGYPTRGAAAEASNNFTARKGAAQGRTHPYLCPLCKAWHIGRDHGRKFGRRKVERKQR